MYSSGKDRLGEMTAGSQTHLVYDMRGRWMVLTGHDYTDSASMARV